MSLPAPAALAITLAIGTAGGLACAEPRTSATQCTGLALDRPMLVLESDRSSASALGRIDTNGCFTETADASLGADPSLTASRGRPFVCVREQGVVLEIDPRGPSILRTVAAFAEGESLPNPHDVAVDDAGRLWIARYDLPSIGVIEPDGSWAATIDLSALGGADGIPDMEAITVFEGRAYVSIERLGADYIPEGPGRIAVVGTSPPHDMFEPIELAGHNPFGRLIPIESDPSGATVVVATPGDFDAVDDADGIERVHLPSGERSMIARETALGGSAIEVIAASPDETYAIVAGPEQGINPTSVVQIDPEAGTVLRTLAGPAPGFVHSGLALNGPYLVVGDRTYGAATIRFFDRATGREVGTLAPAILPPLSLLTLAP